MSEKDLLYQVVAARRLQWDNLVWQAPVLSLTAQAFLFSVSLAGDTSRLARMVSSALSVVIAVLSIQLMTKHRLNEFTDAEWLQNYERQRWPGDEVHGSSFLARRTANKDVIWYLRWKSYWVWTIGLALFGLAGLAIFVLAAFGTHVLTT